MQMGRQFDDLHDRGSLYLHLLAGESPSPTAGPCWMGLPVEPVRATDRIEAAVRDRIAEV